MNHLPRIKNLLLSSLQSKRLLLNSINRNIACKRYRRTSTNLINGWRSNTIYLIWIRGRYNLLWLLMLNWLLYITRKCHLPFKICQKFMETYFAMLDLGSNNTKNMASKYRKIDSKQMNSLKVKLMILSGYA